MAPWRRSPSNDIGDVIDHVLVTDSRPSSWLEHRRAATPTPPSGPGRAAGQLIISVLRHFRCYISSVLHQSLQPQPPPPLPSSRDRHSHTNPQADSLPSMKSERNAYRSADLVHAHCAMETLPKRWKMCSSSSNCGHLLKPPILYQLVQPVELVRLIVFREFHFTIPSFLETQSRNIKNCPNCLKAFMDGAKNGDSYIIQWNERDSIFQPFNQFSKS